ncbi:O-methyltransferase [Emcibacter nanhaiensis]|uniref:O-methyltransferase n=1 Tax=Emcibacter nanhaiensis TaxID=1505037 RepID=A0A501PGA1_9PROT|nr:O-methyltransferase [Emcibacter nanhaiensis]TPD59483.1 O-methyltransferase [Emcibacter nanhaiensis]
MSQQKWSEVDAYYTDLLLRPNPVLDEVARACNAAGLPPIAVSEAQGKFLYLLASIQGAGKILEIGTLGGYSTIWLARALGEGGRLISLEYEERHAAVARDNIKLAGLDKIAEVRVGKALDRLPEIEANEEGPFDLIFIDADKPNNPNYLTWAMKLTKPGSVIVSDNVVRNGNILDEQSLDKNIQGLRRFNEMVADDSRVTSTVIQTVGEKGYDGFMLTRVIS